MWALLELWRYWLLLLGLDLGPCLDPGPDLGSLDFRRLVARSPLSSPLLPSGCPPCHSSPLPSFPEIDQRRVPSPLVGRSGMGRLLAGVGATAPGPPRRQLSRRGPGRRFRPRQKRFPTGAQAPDWTSRGAPGSSGRCAGINVKTLKYETKRRKEILKKKLKAKIQNCISTMKDYSSIFLQKVQDRSKAVDFAICVKVKKMCENE